MFFTLKQTEKEKDTFTQKGILLWQRQEFLQEKDLPKCPKCSSLLRPDVVWFGESVPLFEDACELVSQADFLLVVGTSLAVMPAASLLSYIDLDTPCALVDPDADALTPPGVLAINTTAGEGVPALVNQWRKQGNLMLP